MWFGDSGVLGGSGVVWALKSGSGGSGMVLGDSSVVLGDSGVVLRAQTLFRGLRPGFGGSGVVRGLSRTMQQMKRGLGRGAAGRMAAAPAVDGLCGGSPCRGSCHPSAGGSSAPAARGTGSAALPAGVGVGCQGLPCLPAWISSRCLLPKAAVAVARS